MKSTDYPKACELLQPTPEFRHSCGLSLAGLNRDENTCITNAGPWTFGGESERSFLGYFFSSSSSFWWDVPFHKGRGLEQMQHGTSQRLFFQQSQKWQLSEGFSRITSCTFTLSGWSFFTQTRTSQQAERQKVKTCQTKFDVTRLSAQNLPRMSFKPSTTFKHHNRRCILCYPKILGPTNCWHNNLTITNVGLMSGSHKKDWSLSLAEIEQNLHWL